MTELFIIIPATVLSIYVFGSLIVHKFYSNIQ